MNNSTNSSSFPRIDSLRLETQTSQRIPLSYLFIKNIVD